MKRINTKSDKAALASFVIVLMFAFAVMVTRAMMAARDALAVITTTN